MLRQALKLTSTLKLSSTFKPSMYNKSVYYFQQQPNDEQNRKDQLDISEDDPLKQMMKEEEQKKTGFEEDEGSYTKDNSTIFIYTMGAMSLVIGYVFMQLNMLSYNNKTATKQVKVSYTGKAQIGGPWKLLTLDGQTVTHKDLKGYYYLIYFGFCNCPDICPQSLYKLTRALERIRASPEGKLLKLKTIFVTVDPDRDDTPRIKKFLSHFDPSIIPLTGASNDDPDLKESMRTFKIYASKISYELDEQPKVDTSKPKEKEPYTIDHTIITYLMDDENNYVTHLGSNLGEFDLSKTIVEKIMENERTKMNKYK